MTGFSGFVLEQSIDRGWHQFEEWLGAALALAEDGDSLVLETEPRQTEGSDPGPRLVFSAGADDLLRVEMVGNRQLDRSQWLTDDQSALLVEIGFEAPMSPTDALARGGSTAHHVDASAADGPRLAAMGVRALREVHGVLHPAFLSIGGDVRRPYDGDSYAPLDGAAPSSLHSLDADGMPASGTLAKDWELAAAGPIAIPDDQAHLRHLVDQALIPLLGHRALVDEDGDFVIPWAGSLVFVRVIDQTPAVAIFSQLAAHILHPEVALHEVAELNGAVDLVKFFLVDDRIVAGCTLPASPFVGAHLREALMVVGAVVRDFQQPLTLMAGEGPAFPA